ncbi:N-acylneuraminate cytidylyltransferase A [Drosophila subobscura]|uniref:N-acylneuraminate cytidylyltransferase A n=1 Tax=Drosophila subobscura TaxID=7241 RepID=UPI00155A2858|nr:N-acylneuraminate cytidylyltransferase A [Drosophila subobscura]
MIVPLGLLLILAQLLFQIESTEICSKSELHALILARGGSKGIKYKNLVEIAGLSLLARTIIKIQNSACFDHIWVSTDDKRIATEAEKYGAIVHVRPPEFAMDDTSSLDAIKEFLDTHKAIHNFSLFQCTSVFLKEEYIKDAALAFKNHDCVFAAKRSHYLRWEYIDNLLVPVGFNSKARPRRQDWKGDIVETGMFYFSKRRLVENGVLQNDRCSIVEIDEQDGLEIDSPIDLTIARCIINNKT